MIETIRFKIKMAEELDVETIFKLKVDGLKQELGQRGLLKTGSKAELQTRLLSFITTHDGAAILKSGENEAVDENSTEDEELKKELEASLDNLDTPTNVEDGHHVDLTDDIVTTPTNNQPTENTNLPATKTTSVPTAINSKENTTLEKNSNAAKPALPPVKTVSLQLTEDQRKENRSKRFGGAVSETEKKKSRMERFSSSLSGKAEPVNATDKEKINKRAERFGAVSSVLTKTSETERLKQRQERFVDDKIKKRQERFGVVQATTKSNTDMEARKLQRAKKFGVK
ncbi:SAP domain-containing ribonucleoprotein-like [Hydractinia symbiolongicarpus]|uniref:SAP domain-containing ribonucleoprotein-like n=1 Tax=Hydractinia symbiolongicarpus TaxID=13093 RepID=UPI002549EC1C|nr:SAP domain-containing ribonucleoprotein-like [Hydractinia symbiolongicarpus]